MADAPRDVLDIAMTGGWTLESACGEVEKTSGSGIPENSLVTLEEHWVR